MKTQHSFLITRYSNGFAVQSQGDEKQFNGRFVATTEEQVIAIVEKEVNRLFKEPVAATSASGTGQLAPQKKG